MPINGKDYARFTAPNRNKTTKASEAIPEVFAQRMKEERKKHGLTQEELADLAQVSLDTIKRYESGSKGMRLDVAYDIACSLNIPLQTLLPPQGNEAERILHEVEALIPYLSDLVKTK